MGLQYLPYQQVNKIKWDACITNASNGLIYAHTFYLDNMAKNWDAIVLNDYEAVMPLPWNKKFGFAYLYTPPFIQQLGIFSAVPVGETIAKSFVSLAQQQFRFAELFVNFGNGAVQPNYILPLLPGYQHIRHGYKNDLQKNLKHAATFAMHYQPCDDIEATVELYKSHYANRTPHVKERDYEQFKKVCQAAKTKNYLLIRRVVDDKDKLLAVTLLLRNNSRLYNLMSVTTIAGRHCEASHYLFDQLIAEFAGQDMVLDFEGSSIEGIANFYKKFGAVNQPYFMLRYNCLPWPFKYFK